ncbi:toxin HicA [uncultured Desulfovibrio sp.]|uniref:toxin HicA n=1 Tax=uncultured Desulfovibrio sp. TaxID=167968 RepID=UPI0025995E92|nr:toxin HicA [uncultured Desulfovibrio sp.]
MGSLEKTLAKMRETAQNVRYAELAALCEHFFGPPRQKGTSHAVYKMPWQGDPRVNIQEGKGGKAKAYQVKQVLAAIARLRGE